MKLYRNRFAPTPEFPKGEVRWYPSARQAKSDVSGALTNGAGMPLEVAQDFEMPLTKKGLVELLNQVATDQLPPSSDSQS